MEPMKKKRKCLYLDIVNDARKIERAKLAKDILTNNVPDESEEGEKKNKIFNIPEDDKLCVVRLKQNTVKAEKEAIAKVIKFLEDKITEFECLVTYGPGIREYPHIIKTLKENEVLTISYDDKLIATQDKNKAIEEIQQNWQEWIEEVA